MRVPAGSRIRLVKGRGYGGTQLLLCIMCLHSILVCSRRQVLCRSRVRWTAFRQIYKNTDIRTVESQHERWAALVLVIQNWCSSSFTSEVP